MPVPGELKTVAVIGNGIIGHGIAEVFGTAGIDVMMIGRSNQSLVAAQKRIRASLDLFRENELMSEDDAARALDRVRLSTKLEDAAIAELVIEAVPEDMALKHQIFGRLDTVCRAPTVLASSSGHPASELAANVRHRGRVVATHFWYPPQLLPLVEVCAGPETHPEIVPWTCRVLQMAGKEPVVIDQEVPGFIGNRIQFAALREAWSLWAAGVASAEAIDSVVRHSIGRRLGITGPIESADVGGLDTMYNFARFLQPSLDALPEPPVALGELVARGHRGLPSGRGVYDWSSRDGDALLAARKKELLRWLKVDREAKGRKQRERARWP